MLVVVINDLYTAAMLLVLAHKPDVIIQKIKAFKGLHQSRGRYVGFGTAAPVPQGQRPCEGSGKTGFDVLSRDKNKGFMKPHHIGAFQLKPKKIVYDEFVKRLQQERLSPERCTVQLFPLLVAEGLFDDLNTELRPFRREIVLVIIEVSKETVNSLPQFLASDLSPVSDAFGILKDYGPVLTLNLSQGWQEQRQGRPFPPFPSLRRSFCGNSME